MADQDYRARSGTDPQNYPLQGIDISPVIAILLIDLVIKRILLGLLSPY